MTTTTATRLATSPLYAVLPAEDLGRARTFYSEMLGLQIEDAPSAGGFYVHAGSGTRFLVYERARTKAEHTVASFVVDDLHATMTELRSRGIVFEEYDMPGLKTEHGVATFGTQLSAWFTDTEGNIISVGQM